MQSELKGASWALGLWGALSVIFGAIVLAWPGITLKAFLVVLGAYLVTSGLVMLVGSFVNRQGKWVLGALMGLISIVSGLYVFANPLISGLVALYVIAIWSISSGMLQIAAGFEGRNNWWLIVSGLVYTWFGFYIFARPVGGALTLMWIIGLSNIVGGILLLVTAFDAYGASNRVAAKK
jgi:uncharacterized membrane protein HdeD (DUF308 family)